LTAFPITLTSASLPVSFPTLKVTSYEEAVTNLEDALQFLQSKGDIYLLRQTNFRKSFFKRKTIGFRKGTTNQKSLIILPNPNIVSLKLVKTLSELYNV
jgi:hypothetical protein